MDCQRQILDELMGKNRNLSRTELIKRNEQYSDPEVCKHFLVLICLNELFPNTAHDEGECKFRHDPIFKFQFDNDDSLKKLKNEKKYLIESIKYVETKVNDVDTKIRQKKQQLDQPNTMAPELEISKELAERVEGLENEIRRLLAQSTILGEQGQLNDSEILAEKAEQLRMQKEEAIRHPDNPQMSKDQKVCEICGAFQAANDTEKRIKTHLEGKIHQGFKYLRENLISLKERKEKLSQKIQDREQTEGSPSSSPERQKKKKKKEKKSKHKRSKSRDRSKSKSYDSRDRSHSRDRNHKKHKKKSKKSRRYSDSY